MVIYAYGVIDSKDTIDETIFGLEGAGVYNVSYRDIGVAVSELRQNIQETTDANVLKHEEVIETLMAKFTILPVKFSTIFNTKEALLSMVESYYQDFKDNLVRLHNKVEFGIKVIWQADIIKQRIVAALDKAKRNVVISTDSPAKSFVKEKYEKHIIEKEFGEEANSCIAAVDDHFNKIVVEKKLRRLQTGDLLLNASYLVENQRQNDFRRAFEQLKNAPGDLKLLFSGPWPCYNFINLTKKPSSVDYFNTEDMLNRLLAGQGLPERNAV
jgi:hypothetical protein